MYGTRGRRLRQGRDVLLLALGVSFVLLVGAFKPALGRPLPSTSPTQPSQVLDQSTVENFQRDGVKLNFEDVDIKTLARIIGQITGRNIVIDQKVQGKVTLISPGRLSADEAWEMFVSALEAYGFGVELVDGVYRVTAIAAVKQRQTRLYPNTRGARVLVAVIRMARITSDQAVNAVRPLLTPTGVVTAVPNSNTVVVMDDAVTVRRIIALSKKLDVATDKPVLRIYYPRRVRAADVAKNIEALFPDRANFKITVHAPTNSLLVVALAEQHRIVDRLLQSLERREQVEVEPRQFFVFYLQHAQADDMAKVLAEMLSERQRVEQQIAQSGVPTSQSPTTSPAGGVQPPGFVPSTIPGSQAMQSTVEPTRENPNPTSTPFPRGAETRPPASNYPVGAAQLVGPQSNYVSNKVSADVSNNALVFYMTPAEYNIVHRLVEQLDIPRKQVLVSAIIAEVSPKHQDTTGINWQLTSKKGIIAGLGAGQSLQALVQQLQTGAFVLGSIDPTRTNINVGGQNVAFPNNYAILNFLTSTTDFNVLSSPRLVTRNNKQADISVGQVVPFATGVKFDINGQPIVNFDYREVGLDLKLTPHISQGQNVRLEVHQNLQEVVDFFKTGSGSASVSVPVVSKREVNTEVSLENGQTLVIGGLVQKSTLLTVKKVPFLGDLPLLGDLFFKQKDKTVQKTTLFIFLTPHIVDSPQKIKEINDQYEQMLERLMRADKKYVEEWDFHPATAPATPTPSDPSRQPRAGPSVNGQAPTQSQAPPQVPKPKETPRAPQGE